MLLLLLLLCMPLLLLLNHHHYTSNIPNVVLLNVISTHYIQYIHTYMHAYIHNYIRIVINHTFFYVEYIFNSLNVVTYGQILKGQVTLVLKPLTADDEL